MYKAAVMGDLPTAKLAEKFYLKGNIKWKAKTLFLPLIARLP